MRLAAAATFGVALALSAAPLCQAQPNAIVDEALAFHAQKQWSRAIAVLQEGANSCASQPQPDGCRLLLQYSMAYTYEQQAGAEPQNQKELLARAIAIYGEIRKQVPAHSPTINNLLLIYQRLGDAASAQTLASDAVKADPKNADRYRLMLADIYESAGQPARARDSLLRDLDASDSADVRLRLAVLFRQERAPNLQQVFDLGRRWEPSFPLAARSAFETVMARGSETGPLLAEQALVRWVVLLASNNKLSLASLTGLPSKWDNRGAAQLQEFLNSPWTPLAESNWWRDPNHPERGLALASAALSLGGQTLASGQAASRVEQCWRIGLEASPSYEYYRFNSVPDSEQGVRLDLVTSLIGLYDKYPELETAGGFDQLQCDLFQGKNLAYELSDLEAIQRHHTILGLLYAGKGIWAAQQNLNCQSRSFGSFVVQGRFRGAFFQLENAIRTAERRAARPDGVYQPLAQLKERLAEGHERAGTSGLEQAVRWRAAALEAYLDDDDLEGAQRNQAWVRQRRASIAPAAQHDIDRLGAILRLRLEARNREGELVRALERGAAPPESLRPLARATGDTFRDGFLERQRFKVLADLSASAEGLGPAYQRAARSAAYEAYRVSVDNKVTLMGAPDVERIQHVTNTLAATLGLGRGQGAAGEYVSWSGRTNQEPAAPQSETGTALRISLDARSPILARFDSSVALGGEIVKAVGIDRWITSDAALEVTSGRVRVQGVEAGSVDLEPILKAQPNYRSVKIDYEPKATPKDSRQGVVRPSDVREVPRKVTP